MIHKQICLPAVVALMLVGVGVGIQFACGFQMMDGAWVALGVSLVLLACLIDVRLRLAQMEERLRSSEINAFQLGRDSVTTLRR